MRLLLLSLLVFEGPLPAAENITPPISVEALPGSGTDPNRYFVREYRVSHAVVEWATEEERRKQNPEEARRKAQEFLTSGGVTFPPPNFAMYSRATETMIVKDTAAGQAIWAAKIAAWKKAHENHLKAEKAAPVWSPENKATAEYDLSNEAWDYWNTVHSCHVETLPDGLLQAKSVLQATGLVLQLGEVAV